ncbi:MAG: hypothetical protein IID36_03455 [Planctomycetes bacterium]|nr:hypothetical protein [Planctomycetota bacterium]
MEKDTQNEIIVAVVFILLILLFLNPFGLWMPDTLVYMLIAGVIILFALFAGFVWKERARDEREQLHKMIAGRLAYLAGTGVLVLGIAVQGFTLSHVDPWLLFALLAMILGKIVGFFYSRSRH